MNSAHQSAGRPLARRAIEEGDFERIERLFKIGFPERPLRYWRDGFARLRTRCVPEGYPRYGYLFTVGEKLVGAILTIYSRVPTDGTTAIRCNLSSWYVDPAYRAYAPLLYSLRQKGVGYLNVSPAPATEATIEAQGFSRLFRDRFLALPALRLDGLSSTIHDAAIASGHVPEPERILLQEHAALGCLCLLVEADGRFHPFIFKQTRVIKQSLPSLLLAYCRDWNDFARFTGSLGRYLLRRGWWTVVIADGDVRGLIGLRIERGRCTYYRGQSPPHGGDLAYTEEVYFD
jgi:hypothetical protein